jgi:zinc/manganese transport system permease protein
LACLSSVAGLTLSYNLDIPAGPAIVLTAGGLWLLSLLTGPRASLWRQAIPNA